MLCVETSSPSELAVLVMYKKPVLKCCLLTTNTQKCAVRRSSVTCWVVRDTKVTAVAVGGPGLEFVWLQVLPLDYNDPFPWRVIAWDRHLCLTSGFWSLPSLVKVCQEEIFLGAEASHGVWGKMVMLDHNQ